MWCFEKQRWYDYFWHLRLSPWISEKATEKVLAACKCSKKLCGDASLSRVQKPFVICGQLMTTGKHGRLVPFRDSSCHLSQETVKEDWQLCTDHHRLIYKVKHRNRRASLDKATVQNYYGPSWQQLIYRKLWSADVESNSNCFYYSLCGNQLLNATSYLTNHITVLKL